MEKIKNAKETATAPPPPKTAEPAAKEETRKKPATAPPKPKNLPLFNVILLDDDDHTYEYVIEMLGKIFAYPSERGYQLAKEVDSAGRVIVLTTHKELAELKRDQIQAYGCDPRLSRSSGSMSATIEPAM
jgi:ATP-dependent Clp protease adaptor protein ClpS